MGIYAGLTVFGRGDGDFSFNKNARIGDVNGDGIDDFAVGGPYSSNTQAGSVYVVFGVDGPGGASLPESFNVADLDGDNGFEIIGDNVQIVSEYYGTNTNYYGGIASFISGGDVNGDGLSDIVFATETPRYSDYGLFTGVFVVFGRDTDDTPFDATFQLAEALQDAENGAAEPQAKQIVGVDGILQSLSAEADVNGDGVNDIIIGQQPEPYYGFGDFGDGPIDVSSFNDIAPFADAPVGLEAIGYVVFGGEDPGGPTDRQDFISVEGLDGSNGFTVFGDPGQSPSFYGDFGDSRLIPIGDVNGDGFDDIFGVVATPGYDDFGVSLEGNYAVDRRGFLILGKNTDPDNGGETFQAEIDATVEGPDSTPVFWSGLTNPTGFYYDNYTAEGAIGDINGDGFDDFAFSEYALSAFGDQRYGPEDFRAGRGVVHVLFGGPEGIDPLPPTDDGFPTFFNGFASDGADDVDGFAIFSTAERDSESFNTPSFGTAIAGVGDVNGDGIDDFIIGQSYSNYGPGDDDAPLGSVVLVFGRDESAGDTFPTFLDVDGANGIADELGYRIDGIADPNTSLFGRRDFNQTEFGQYISAAGDVDGDGFDDFIIGYPRGDAPGADNAGNAFLVRGGPGLEVADNADGANDNVISVENLGVDVDTAVTPINLRVVNSGRIVDSNPEGDPGGPQQSLVFIVTRSGDLTETVRFDWAVTPDALASAGFRVDADDFPNGVLPSGTETFESGAFEARVEVPINQDFINEANERALFTISNPSTDGSSPISILGEPSAIGVVQNDDQPVRFDLRGGGGTQELDGDDGAQPGRVTGGILFFQIVRSGPRDVDASVDVTLRPSDFFADDPVSTPLSADLQEIRIQGVADPIEIPVDADTFTVTVDFPASSSSIKNFEIVVVGDEVEEPSETVFVELSNPQAVGKEAELTGTTRRSGEIINDDFPDQLRVSAFPRDTLEDNEVEQRADDLLEFVISRISPDDRAVVTYEIKGGISTSGFVESADASDIASIEDENGKDENITSFPVRRTVVFEEGEREKVVAVNPVVDNIIEEKESVRLEIVGATTTNPSGIEGVGRFFDGFILNDDVARGVAVSFTPGAVLGAVNFDIVPEGDLPEENAAPNFARVFFNRSDDDGALTINFAARQSGFNTADGLDIRGYAINGGAFQFDPITGFPIEDSITLADGVTSGFVDFFIEPDNAFERNENFTVEITSLSQGGYGIFGASVTVEIGNDDGRPPNFGGRRPIPADVDGDGVVEPGEFVPGARIFGDPHIVTLDGLGYSFQAVGDYILAESVDQSADDAFQVQARFEPLPGSELVSITTRVAVKIGDRVVEIVADAAEPLLVDGVVPAHDFAVDGPFDVDGDGEADAFFDADTGLFTLVLLRDDDTDKTPLRGLEVSLQDTDIGDFLNVSLFLAPQDVNGAVHGLQGNANGDLSDEFGLRSGDAPPPGAVSVDDNDVPSPTFDFLYGAYRDSWRLTGEDGDDNQSLFTAGDDPFDPGFPAGVISVDDLPPELVVRGATATAEIDEGIRDFALLDFLLTGEEEFIESAEQSPPPENVAAPTAAPDIPDLLSISADATEVLEGDSGRTEATFTLFRPLEEGQTGASFTVNVTLGGNMDADDGLTLDTPVIEFTEEDTERQVTVSFNGDLTNEGDEDIKATIAVDDPSVSVAGSMASVTVLTDDTPPDLVDDIFSTDADKPFDGDLTLANPIAADNDAQGDEIEIIAIVASDDVRRPIVGSPFTLPSGAVLTLASNGVFGFNPEGDDGAPTDFEQLAEGVLATERFTYVAVDGNGGESRADVAITVTGVARNAAPVAENVTVNGGEDSGPIAINLLNENSDPDDEVDALTVEIVDGPSQGNLTPDGAGGFTYAGDPDLLNALPDGQTDFDTFTYKILDDGGAESEVRTVTIVIEGVNDAPTAEDATANGGEDSGPIAIALLNDDSDPDDAVDALTVEIVDGPSKGNLTPDGAGGFTYEGDPDQLNALPDGQTDFDSFTYKILDDGGAESETRTFSIVIEGVNDAPTAEDVTVNGGEDSGPIAIALLNDDSDPDDDVGALTVRIVDGPSQGDLTPDGAGGFTYEGHPDPLNALPDGQTDFDTFTYTILDDGGAASATRTVTIAIEGVNDAPEPIEENLGTVSEDDAPVTFNVLDAIVDVDSAPESLSVSNVEASWSGGDLQATVSNGVIAFDPDQLGEALDAGDNAEVTINFDTSDGVNTTGNTLMLTVEGADDGGDPVFEFIAEAGGPAVQRFGLVDDAAATLDLGPALGDGVRNRFLVEDLGEDDALLGLTPEDFAFDPREARGNVLVFLSGEDRDSILFRDTSLDDVLRSFGSLDDDLVLI